MSLMQQVTTGKNDKRRKEVIAGLRTRDRASREWSPTLDIALQDRTRALKLLAGKGAE